MSLFRTSHPGSSKTPMECSRTYVTKIESVKELKGEPKDDSCHVYYIHRDGTTYCSPNQEFDPSQEPSATIEAQQIPQCADDRLVLVHFPKSKLAEIENKANDSISDGSGAIRPEGEEEGWEEPEKNEMPRFFADHLKGICEHCECKKEILWRNFQRPEQHFDACFRYFDQQKESKEPHQMVRREEDSQRGKERQENINTRAGGAVEGEDDLVNKPKRQDSLGKQEPHNKCFLKLYSLRVPCLSEIKHSTVVLSLVYHTRVVGNEYVSLNDDCTSQRNKEHMFGFIAGFSRKEIGKLLRDRLIRWQDIAKDHVFRTSAALTPRLLIATVLAQFGETISQDVITAARTLQKCDLELEHAIKNLNGQTDGEETTKSIQDFNQKLIRMNRDLTGTRSTMHYLGNSANFLVNRYATYDTYVTARLMEWRGERMEDFEALKKALHQLDIWREAYRDRDKNEIVRKSMDQYKTDVKSLQQHIDITVGMVRNLIAERDRGIQLGVLEKCAKILENSNTTLDNSDNLLDNSDRQAANMKYLAFLTAILLPGTSMAIFLTTPMFSWDPFEPTDGSGARLKSFRIYWGVTTTTSGLLFIALLCFIADDLEDGWLKRLILQYRPKWSMFRKRKNAKQKRQDSMRDESHVSSVAVAHGSVNGAALINGSRSNTLQEIRRNLDAGVLPR